jgi:hypothetical protein
LKFRSVVTIISVICLLFSVYLALLSLETFGAPLNIKLDASLKMQLLILATFFFVIGIMLLICLAVCFVMKKAF